MDVVGSIHLGCMGVEKAGTLVGSPPPFLSARLDSSTNTAALFRSMSLLTYVHTSSSIHHHQQIINVLQENLKEKLMIDTDNFYILILPHTDTAAHTSIHNTGLVWSH